MTSYSVIPSNCHSKIHFIYSVHHRDLEDQFYVCIALCCHESCELRLNRNCLFFFFLAQRLLRHLYGHDGVWGQRMRGRDPADGFQEASSGCWEVLIFITCVLATSYITICHSRTELRKLQLVLSGFVKEFYFSFVQRINDKLLVCWER